MKKGVPSGLLFAVSECGLGVGGFVSEATHRNMAGQAAVAIPLKP